MLQCTTDFVSTGLLLMLLLARPPHRYWYWRGDWTEILKIFVTNAILYFYQKLIASGLWKSPSTFSHLHIFKLIRRSLCYTCIPMHLGLYTRKLQTCFNPHVWWIHFSFCNNVFGRKNLTTRLKLFVVFRKVLQNNLLWS